MLKPQCTSKRGRVLLRTRAVSEVVEAAQTVAVPDLTWQIAAGAAGTRSSSQYIVRLERTDLSLRRISYSCSHCANCGGAIVIYV